MLLLPLPPPLLRHPNAERSPLPISPIRHAKPLMPKRRPPKLTSPERRRALPPAKSGPQSPVTVRVTPPASGLKNHAVPLRASREQHLSQLHPPLLNGVLNAKELLSHSPQLRVPNPSRWPSPVLLLPLSPPNSDFSSEIQIKLICLLLLILSSSKSQLRS